VPLTRFQQPEVLIIEGLGFEMLILKRKAPAFWLGLALSDLHLKVSKPQAMNRHFYSLCIERDERFLAGQDFAGVLRPDSGKVLKKLGRGPMTQGIGAAS
jgi:hypothetical protein